MGRLDVLTRWKSVIPEVGHLEYLLLARTCKYLMQINIICSKRFDLNVKMPSIDFFFFFFNENKAPYENTFVSNRVKINQFLYFYEFFKC